MVLQWVEDFKDDDMFTPRSLIHAVSSCDGYSIYGKVVGAKILSKLDMD